MEGVWEVKWLLCYSGVCCYRRGVGVECFIYSNLAREFFVLSFFYNAFETTCEFFFLGLEPRQWVVFELRVNLFTPLAFES